MGMRPHRVCTVLGQQQQQVWCFEFKSLSIYSMHHARYCLATGNSLCFYPQQQQQPLVPSAEWSGRAAATFGALQPPPISGASTTVQRLREAAESTASDAAIDHMGGDPQDTPPRLVPSSDGDGLEGYSPAAPTAARVGGGSFGAGVAASEWLSPTQVELLARQAARAAAEAETHAPAAAPTEAPGAWKEESLSGVPGDGGGRQMRALQEALQLASMATS